MHYNTKQQLTIVSTVTLFILYIVLLCRLLTISAFCRSLHYQCTIYSNKVILNKKYALYMYYNIDAADTLFVYYQMHTI